MERTFIAIKPDAVQRGLTGKIISRLEQEGFKLVAMKFMHVTRELACRHYEEHKEKPFFEDLVNFITSGPIVAMVWEGKDIIEKARTVMGKTNPKEAAPGTIRAMFGTDIGKNVVHGSDSIKSSIREIGIFFKDEEILSSYSNV